MPIPPHAGAISPERGAVIAAFLDCWETQLNALNDLRGILTPAEADAFSGGLDRLSHEGCLLAADFRELVTKRSRDEAGCPVIPGLDDAAGYAFDDLWEKAREFPLDDACAKLNALYQLGKHHPSLQPEMALLKQIDEVHGKLTRNLISERLAKL